MYTNPIKLIVRKLSPKTSVGSDAGLLVRPRDTIYRDMNVSRNAEFVHFNIKKADRYILSTFFKWKTGEEARLGGIT